MPKKQSTKKPAFEPLGIVKCTSSACEKGLHCFRKTTRSPHPVGACRSCGAMLVNWNEIHRRDPASVEETFAVMRLELIRHHFWHAAFTQRAINYALRKGRQNLAVAVRRRIETSVGRAYPVRDGVQTPREESPNPIHFAQHATASCCRVCIEEWHGIPMGRPLTTNEIDYLTKLAIRYLAHRFPDLPTTPQKVPPIRTRKDGQVGVDKAA